jgi:small subunit ribosomal protein S21
MADLLGDSSGAEEEDAAGEGEEGDEAGSEEDGDEDDMDEEEEQEQEEGQGGDGESSDDDYIKHPKSLKKKLQREGVYREMKLRRHFEKPSEKRAREKAAAVRRARKMDRKRAERDGVK